MAMVEAHVGGETVKVERKRAPEPGGKRSGGGPRGVVKRLTRRAKRAMRRRLGTIRLNGEGIAVTLTYPGHRCPTGKEAQRDRANLLRRLRRRFPELAAVWKIEGERRKSGPHRGRVVPHFHLVVYNVDVHVLQAVLPGHWSEITGGLEHIRHGSWIRQVRHPARYRWYMAKQEEPELSEALGACGRRWGIVGRKYFPYAERVVLYLPVHAASRLLRWMRRCTGVFVQAMLSINPARWIEAAKLARGGPT